MTWRRRVDEEDGVSLVELLTAMAVSAVVLAFVSATVINALRSQERQRVQVAALAEAKIAFERVTRELRTADPLRLAEPERVRLDTGTGGGPLRTLTYQRVSDRLVSTDAATGEVTTLATDLAPDQPPFSFHLFDGSTVNSSPVVDTRSVESITVRLRLEPEGATRPIDLENRVLLRNARG